VFSQVVEYSLSTHQRVRKNSLKPALLAFLLALLLAQFDLIIRALALRHRRRAAPLATGALMSASHVYGQARPGGTVSPAIPPGGSIMTPGPQPGPIGVSPTISNNPAGSPVFTNGLPAGMATNGNFTGTNGFPPGFGTNAAKIAATNYFVPAGVDGFYRLGSNGFYRRGTNGFYRLAPSGNYEFIPDGNKTYHLGPDGVYRPDYPDRRGIYRNGILTPDTNGTFSAPTNANTGGPNP
jgi:hypothetical protein